MSFPTTSVNYQIVTAATRTALETAVLVQIKDKWMPVGGVVHRPADFVTPELYLQTMVPQGGNR